ncbi:MAG TPA: MltA domain-containing protein [Anaeromyxobacter sp.]|nr:MltA domain-containing protein [Anaeromyxobacter sp.]
MRRLALASFALALASCRVVGPRAPEPAKTPERALEELSPDAFPAFADDLDYAGLEDALGRSAAYLARLAAADPGRTLAFGKERVPIQKVQATLARFRDLALARPSAAALQEAFRREFRVFRSAGDGAGKMLVTGYYLPEMRGSMVRDAEHPVALHRAPDDLVVVRGKDFPQLDGDLVGRVEGGRLVPYPTRAEIAGGALDGKGAELCFVDSAVDAFFVEIQGSGVVRFPDGTSRVVTFAGKNGHRYAAIGAELVRRGALAKDDVSMQSIRAWLAANPGEAPGLLARNPSYVFFRFADAPTGSLGVPVTPDRTIAADARVFPKGALAFLESERPVDAAGAAMRPFSRFVLDQDAGGAVRTSGHVDLYLGSGAYAENAAGRMKQQGRLYYLLLR